MVRCVSTRDVASDVSLARRFAQRSSDLIGAASPVRTVKLQNVRARVVQVELSGAPRRVSGFSVRAAYLLGQGAGRACPGMKRIHIRREEPVHRSVARVRPLALVRPLQVQFNRTTAYHGVSR